MKEGISGFVFAKNAIKLDYCLELAARSLLPVVDELILCDSNSTDGTADLMHSIEGAKVINFDVPTPLVTPYWCPEWRNFVRERCQYKMHITLDADEVLDDRPESHAEIRSSTGLVSPRIWTFWRDELTLLPFGCCEADYCVKIAPSDRHCQYGDTYEDRPPDPASVENPKIQIFHLGFLRKKEPMVEKCTLIHTVHWGRLDDRYSKGHAEGKKVHEIDWGWNAPLRPYSGHYPPGVLEWIRARKDL